MGLPAGPSPCLPPWCLRSAPPRHGRGAGWGLRARLALLSPSVPLLLSLRCLPRRLLGLLRSTAPLSLACVSRAADPAARVLCGQVPSSGMWALPALHLCAARPHCPGGAAPAVRRLVHCLSRSAVPEPPRRPHRYSTRPPASGGPRPRCGLPADGPAVGVRLHDPVGHEVALRALAGFPSLTVLAHPVAAAPKPSLRGGDPLLPGPDRLCRIFFLAPFCPDTLPGPHLAGPPAPATLLNPGRWTSRLLPDWALCSSLARCLHGGCATAHALPSSRPPLVAVADGPAPE